MVGGTEVLSPRLRDNVVDKFDIHITSVIPGAGIPLLKVGTAETSLDLVRVTQSHQFGTPLTKNITYYDAQ